MQLHILQLTPFAVTSEYDSLNFSKVFSFFDDLPPGRPNDKC